MKTPGISPTELKIIKNILKTYTPQYTFFYYGSRVKGDFTKLSDLDILIQGTTEMPLILLDDIKTAFDNSPIPYIIHFTDYQKIPPDFYQSIKNTLHCVF